MKASVTATETLAFVSRFSSFLAVMNSTMSGCQQYCISMSAPWREPPCSIRPVVKL
jgi:hypothetical protein